jgi:hypothetical protein
MSDEERFERKNAMDTSASSLRMFKKDDPEMPPEYREFMIKLLKYAHVENNANPHYKVLLANIANAGLRYAPDGRAMTIEAEIIKQEVNHGQIVAKIIESLGEDPFIDRQVGQYAFRMPLESWIDVSWFHGLIDRVGLYVGIEWMESSSYSSSGRPRPGTRPPEHSLQIGRCGGRRHSLRRKAQDPNTAQGADRGLPGRAQQPASL